MGETLIRVFEDGAKPGRCRSCSAQLMWHETLTGKTMPMNADAVPRKSYRDAATHRVVVYFAASDSHFATCPDVATYSRKATRTARV